MDAAEVRRHDAFISTGFDDMKCALPDDQDSLNALCLISYIRSVVKCLPIENGSRTNLKVICPTDG
jgi:hypothetical protein